jgi:hypothetical protein
LYHPGPPVFHEGQKGKSGKDLGGAKKPIAHIRNCK